MNKNLYIALGVILAILIIGGASFFVGLKIYKNNSIKTPVPIVKQETDQQTKNVADQKTNESVDVVKPGYKKVRVNNGEGVIFSFDVPEKWLAETRHSGEKQLSVEEMRDFLATSSRGDIKTNPKLFSDYVDISWKELSGMDSQAIQDLYHREFFSTASVSGDGFLWYTDWNAGQIDFHVVKDFQKSDMWAVKDFLDAKKKDKTTGWSVEKVNGLDADVMTFPAGKDKNGKEEITKGETGGKIYFIKINGGKDMIVINKEAKGDVQFESDFANLLSTFKIESEANVSSNTCETGGKVYFEVKEFGIKFLVDKGLKDDLIYSVYNPDPADPSHRVASFSTKSLSNLDKGCSAESGAIGSIYKVQGKVNEVDGGFFSTPKDLVKQFPGFFVAFKRSQAVCSEKKQVQDMLRNLSDTLESEFRRNIACLKKNQE